MTNPFFDHPILNSPYAPARHWELDETGQPTQAILERRRPAQFISPIPKPKKHKSTGKQQDIVFDEGKGPSTEMQQYEVTAVINEVRGHVESWRDLPNPDQRQLTPGTVCPPQHWRSEIRRYGPQFIVRTDDDHGWANSRADGQL